METLNTLFIYPLREMLGQVTGFVPTLFSALVVLIVGVVVSKFIRNLVHSVLKKIRLDKLADSVGLSDLLHKGGIKHSITDLITSVVYLIFIVMFIFMAVETIGLTMMTDTLHRLMSYVPQVIAATIALVLGMVIAKIVSHIVSACAHLTGLPNPKFFERVSRWAIILYAVTIALGELGYDSLLVGRSFDILWAGFVFAYALAFGLAGKDRAAEYLKRHSKPKK